MEKTFDKYIVQFVIIFSFIAYFQLFKFVYIPNSIRILSQVAVGGIIILMILFKIIYFPEKIEKMNFAGPILIMLLGSIPSYFVAYFYHNQNFIYSIYANRTFFFLLLYFFFHFYKIPPAFIVKVIVIIGLIAVVLFYVQYYLYPRLILDIRSSEDRGTIRLFVPGMLCSIVAYFYFLNKYFENNKIKVLLLALVCLGIFILQGTRQMIFALFFLTMVNLILSKKVKSKVLMLFAISLASVAVFFLFREIFMELIAVSSKQSQNYSGDIRVRAATFFLTDFMQDTITYIFGNGKSGGVSVYDIKMAYYAKKYGYYISDIGIIGDYVEYGIFFIIGGIMLLVRALTFKTAEQYKFLKYYIMAQCFTLLTGSGFLGGSDIVLISIVYVFDIKLNTVAVENNALIYSK